ncbi:hypothetical protein ElyMa_004991000 [Elysia marginata]|uniref:Uncharacterized protein n=1 Tax=Elysia marginata TaxID=1093978 RepID=A0AAV4J4X1_9GAST|nr:hypothetical protein ElyMa_004991000 [Elysia marginata]
MVEYPEVHHYLLVHSVTSTAVGPPPTELLARYTHHYLVRIPPSVGVPLPGLLLHQFPVVGRQDTQESIRVGWRHSGPAMFWWHW